MESSKLQTQQTQNSTLGLSEARKPSGTHTHSKKVLEANKDVHSSRKIKEWRELCGDWRGWGQGLLQKPLPGRCRLEKPFVSHFPKQHVRSLSGA